MKAYAQGAGRDRIRELPGKRSRKRTPQGAGRDRIRELESERVLEPRGRNMKEYLRLQDPAYDILNHVSKSDLKIEENKS